MFEVKKPIYGSNYYPEAWDRSEIDRDLDAMVGLGLNCVRIAEFAWKTMEPEEGKYDFSLFREVVDKCRERGISVIMGTPTACPPRWLEEKHPELFFVDYHGVRYHHGSRRQVCPNDPIFREYCVKIVEAMAKEFCRDENVIGWQIDNEIDPRLRRYGCCCPTCVEKFRDYEREKYDGDIDKLNREWGNFVFSQQLDDFSQLDHPYEQWNHPSFEQNWIEFQALSQHEFIALQYETLKKYVKVPVGTDMMPIFTHDYDIWAESADVMQFNEYFFGAEFPRVTFWYDFMRTIKPRPFWLTETSCCWNGAVTKNGFRPKHFNRANVWLPIALGAEAANYWLWRSHYGGQELEHGACLLSSGKPSHVAGEIVETSKQFEKASDLICGTKQVKSGVCLVVSTPADRTFSLQPMLPDFNYYDVTSSFHAAIAAAGYRPDVVVPRANLDDYGVIFTPAIPDLTENGLIDRVLERVKDGATWVVGPLSDNRNRSGAKPTDRNLVHLEKIADVKQLYVLPGDEDYSVDMNGTPLGVESNRRERVYEVYECGANAEPLAEYTTGDYTEGKVAITATRYGKGKIVILGFVPDKSSLGAIVERECAEVGLARQYESSDGVVCALRDGEAGTALFAVETLNAAGSVKCPFAAVDALSGAAYECGDVVDVQPYGVVVLKKVTA